MWKVFERLAGTLTHGVFSRRYAENKEWHAGRTEPSVLVNQDWPGTAFTGLSGALLVWFVSGFAGSKVTIARKGLDLFRDPGKFGRNARLFDVPQFADLSYSAPLAASGSKKPVSGVGDAALGFTW